jgi:hypothetical protein
LATAPSPPAELEFAFEPDADLDPLSLAFSDSDMKRLLYDYVYDATSVSTGGRNATEISRADSGVRGNPIQSTATNSSARSTDWWART